MAKRHRYTKSLTIGKWETNISPSTNYGYFENINNGNSGGLWFENNEIIDYDGVYELPQAVIEAVKKLGYGIDSSFERDNLTKNPRVKSLRKTSNVSQILRLARKNVDNDMPMQSSARFALSEAIAAEYRGDINAAKQWGLKSLAYSVGIFHADYKKAEKYMGDINPIKNPRAASPRKTTKTPKVYKVERESINMQGKKSGWIWLAQFPRDAQGKQRAIEYAKAYHRTKPLVGSIRVI